MNRNETFLDRMNRNETTRYRCVPKIASSEKNKKTKMKRNEVTATRMNRNEVTRYRCVPKIASSQKNKKVLQSENEEQNGPKRK